MRFARVRNAIVLVGFACALNAASKSQAITLTIDSVVNQSWPDLYDYETRNAGEARSSVEILDAGGSRPDRRGATLDAGTRFASMSSTDADAFNFGSRSDSRQFGYRVNFTVTPDVPAWATYSVTVNTARFGALVVQDEGDGNGVADITQVEGSLWHEESHDIGLLDLPDVTGLDTGGSQVAHFSQTGTALTLTGLRGVNTFELEFRWVQTTQSVASFVGDAGEGVVLMGLAGTSALIGAADEYPGLAGRTAENDGHFVNISVAVTHMIPEPSSLAIAGIGAVGVAFSVFRKRRKVA